MIGNFKSILNYYFDSIFQSSEFRKCELKVVLNIYFISRRAFEFGDT